MSEWSKTPSGDEAQTEPVAVSNLSPAELMDVIDTERAAGRAFVPLAESCRTELAKRTGQAS